MESEEPHFSAKKLFHFQIPTPVAYSVELLPASNFLFLTGANMAGKSTYMRQVALICLMAQIGSFVPAKEAHLPVCDRIFTRVGASDDLHSFTCTW